MALLLVSACGGGSDNYPEQQPVVCTPSVDPGILIRVTDSASGNPVSCGTRAVVTAGTYSETVDNPPIAGCLDALVLSAAHERPDTYSVTVSKAGYLDFTINDVAVTAGICHVIPVTVEARLSSM